MKTIAQIQKKADQLKAKLIVKAKKQRLICENFGQKEGRQLEDFAGAVHGREDSEEVFAVLNAFGQWAYDYEYIPY